MRHKIIQAFILSSVASGLLLAVSNRVQADEPTESQQQVAMKGKLDGINLSEGYIVANDIRFYVDRSTRVYDQTGALSAKKNLKVGQALDMYFRIPASPLSSSRQAVLEKIVITQETLSDD